MSRLTRPLLSGFALAAALAFAWNAHATVQTHTDVTHFATSAGPLSQQTFNTYTADVVSVSGSLLTLADFSVRGDWVVDAPSLRLDIDGSSNLFLNVSYGGWASLEFSQPVFAFGAWFSRVPASLALDAGGLQGYGSYELLTRLTPTSAPGGAAQFIGFTSDRPFNRVVFEGQGCCSGSFAIDNLAYAYATASAVPEPASWGLLAAGLAGMAARARRRA